MTSEEGMSKISEQLDNIVAWLQRLQEEQGRLSSAVNTVTEKVHILTNLKEIHDFHTLGHNRRPSGHSPRSDPKHIPPEPIDRAASNPSPSTNFGADSLPRRASASSKITLTSYPGQVNVDPIPLAWGSIDPIRRGPVICSRNHSTIKRRNGKLVAAKYSHILRVSFVPSLSKADSLKAIGAHGGSYSTYFALAVASKNLELDHRPDFTNTHPSATISPNSTWGNPSQIVAMDPFGHLAPSLFKRFIDHENVEIRPSIAITRAHMKLPELERSVSAGRLRPDGKICLNAAGELAVTKVAVEPV